jgi:hypothetical protein
MRKMFDQKGFAYKKNRARKRANRAIKKIEGNGGEKNQQPALQ